MQLSLFILELLEPKGNENLGAFISLRLGIILVCWIFVFGGVLIDFWSGISTARALGKPLLSKGFRKTVEKFGDYFKILLFALMFDALGMSLLHFYLVPLMTVVTTVAILLIEGKSVVENCRKKRAHAADVPTIIKKLIKAASTEKGITMLEEISDSFNKNN